MVVETLSRAFLPNAPVQLSYVECDGARPGVGPHNMPFLMLGLVGNYQVHLMLNAFEEIRHPH